MSMLFLLCAGAIWLMFVLLFVALCLQSKAADEPGLPLDAVPAADPAPALLA